MPQDKNPYPGGHEFYNFDRPFVDHHYYIPSLSDLCLGIKKKILKEIIHLPRPSTKIPAPGVMNLQFW